jgi:tetratricopeptide (TPR) repeat protein
MVTGEGTERGSQGAAQKRGGVLRFLPVLVLSALILFFAGPARAAGAPPLPGPAKSDAQALSEIADEVARFEAASKGYKGTVQHVVHQSYVAKRKELVARYDADFKREEADEKQKRLHAIALFEQFLAKYPQDQRWSPDAIFRLAELYFERSYDEYLATAEAARQSGTNTESQVIPDFTRTVDLYRRLIAQFPDYRLIDGAYYLLGYCLVQMNKEAESKQAYLALVCHNKYNAFDPPDKLSPSKGLGLSKNDLYAGCVPLKQDSHFLPESWTRIGEYHFDANELDPAIQAYSQVLKYRDSVYFDKALYKLAWSYYRADRYLDAIKRFDELVVFSDKTKNESGKEGSDLRAEAIQYLGVSFAEKDWNGDGIDDPETGLSRAEAFYRGREKEPHVREIFMRLGDIYFDQTEYAKAADAYKHVLGRWPFSPDNPKVQDRIILCFDRLRNYDQALKEREATTRKRSMRRRNWPRRRSSTPR